MEKAELKELKRNELQKLCKTHKLKAIGKNFELINRLEEHFTSLSCQENVLMIKSEDISNIETLHNQDESDPKPEVKINKGNKARKKKISKKSAKKVKTNKKKNQKRNENDEDIDASWTQGITDEKHKEYIKANSASNSSQESVYHLPSVGNDSVFIPGKLAEETDEVETKIINSSLLHPQPFSSIENTHYQSKVAMISPLVKETNLAIHRTPDVRGCQNHLGNCSQDITNSIEQRLDDKLFCAELDASPSVVGDRDAVTSDCFESDETVCYGEADRTSFDLARQVPNDDADGTMNASSWLARRSCLESSSTVVYSSYDEDASEVEGNDSIVGLKRSKANGTFNVKRRSSGCQSLSHEDNCPDGINTGSSGSDSDKPFENRDCAATLEGDDVVDRRQTFVVEKASYKNMQNQVQVQRKDRRRTFQITVPQETAVENAKLLSVGQSFACSSFEETAFVMEEKELNGEGLEDSSLVIRDRVDGRTPEGTSPCHELTEYGTENVRKTLVHGRRTMVLTKAKDDKFHGDRRGTFVLQKSVDEADKENSLVKGLSKEFSKVSKKDERSAFNHCVGHGTVRNSCGWRKLILERGIVTIQSNSTQNEYERFLLKPADKPLPVGYEDNMICGECVAENHAKSGREKLNHISLGKAVSKKVIGQAKPNNIAKRLPNMHGALKRKCGENHTVESSPATKKQRSGKLGSHLSGSPASPQVRRARGEKIGLPKRLMEPFKPKRVSLERKEDVAYAERVEEMLRSVEPGSKEEMALMMRKKSKIQ